jgi:hypothetical protein
LKIGYWKKEESSSCLSWNRKLRLMRAAFLDGERGARDGPAMTSLPTLAALDASDGPSITARCKATPRLVKSAVPLHVINDDFTAL